MKRFKFCLIMLLVGMGVLLASTPSFAIVIFSDGFEDQPVEKVNNTAYPDPAGLDAFPVTNGGGGGYWVKESSPPHKQVQVTKWATPGAASGNNYLRSSRQSGEAYNTFSARLNTPIETAGLQVYVEADVYIPSLSGMPICIGGGYYDSGYLMSFYLIVGSWSSDVMAYDSTSTMTHTGVPVVVGQWQHWQIDYTVGGSDMNLTIDGLSASGVAMIRPGAPLNRVFFEQDLSMFLLDNLTISDSTPPPPPPHPGDANDDKVVDATDAAFMAQHWLQSTGAAWEDGDFNDDDAVNDLDAAIMAANWNWSATPLSSVPEPSTLMLLVGMLLPVLLRRMK